MSTRIALVLVSVFCFVMVAGGVALAGEASKAADVAEGKKTFITQCASCHGNTGKGDGAAAVALDPKPRDLSNPEYMKSLKDDYITKLLKSGGAAVGKSPLMPALGAAMTDQQLTDLIAFVRTLASAKSEGETAAAKTE